VRLACFLSVVVTGALTASAPAQQATPAGKESSPAVNSSAAHAPAQAMPSEKESAGRPNGPTGAGAPGKGAGGNGAEKAKGAPPSIGKGAAPSTGKESGSGAEPIDTRITVQPRATRKLLPGNEKKMSVPKTPPISAPALQATPRGANAPARNAIGVPLADHVRAHAPIHGPQESRPPGVLGSLGSAGTAMASHPSTAPGGAAAPARNPAVITGTGMARPGSGPGTLGGPAKNAAIINGTRIRPKP